VSGEARVVWGLTAYGPMPYPEVYTSHMLAAIHAANRFRMDFLSSAHDAKSGMVSAYATDRMYTHSAENLLVQRFLEETDGTHLFLTELDMVLPVDTISALLALDKPIASGLYFLRGGTGQACLYVPAPVTPALSKYPHTPVTLFPLDRPFRLAKAGGCPGLGVVLIRRDVLEKIPYPWFDLKEKNPQTGEGYGSDMYFYTKVREAGIEVWVDPRVRCQHMDYVRASIDDHIKRIENNDPDLRRGFIISPTEVIA
jgi:hypothetical protein